MARSLVRQEIDGLGIQLFAQFQKRIERRADQVLFQLRDKARGQANLVGQLLLGHPQFFPERPHLIAQIMGLRPPMEGKITS